MEKIERAIAELNNGWTIFCVAKQKKVEEEWMAEKWMVEKC